MSFALPAPRNTRPHFALPASVSTRGAFVLPVLLYLIFALADLLFSQVAFSYGIAEGNPFMAWLVQKGIFVEGKIAISLAVAGLIALLYGLSRRGRVISWGAVVTLGAVVVYHAWALPQIMQNTA